jgi:hypothetical protein
MGGWLVLLAVGVWMLVTLIPKLIRIGEAWNFNG